MTGRLKRLSATQTQAQADTGSRERSKEAFPRKQRLETLCLVTKR